MLCEEIEKKSLYGYCNPIKALNKPFFAIPVFIDLLGLPAIQLISKGKIVSFEYVDFPPSLIYRTQEEITLGVGDKAIMGYDFLEDSVRGPIGQVAKLLGERMGELSPYMSSTEAAKLFLSDKELLEDAV